MTEHQTSIYYYQYHTRAGTVGIIPEGGHRYKVVFGDDNLGSYSSADAAADDVSGGHTFSPSDGTDLEELDIPAGLGEWERKVFAKSHRLRPG